MPATPTSATSSTVLPISRAVTAASSATGRSLVPAQTTPMVPLPAAAADCVSVMARAELVKLGARFQIAWFRCPHCIIMLARGARGQHVATRLCHAGKDRGHLGGRFSRGKDHLGHAGAQGAMMVELGEAKVFKGEIAQPFQRLSKRRCGPRALR